MKVIVSEVLNASDKKKFIDFPHDLYAGDPNYVPELYVSVDELLDKKKNPYFKHSDAKIYLASREGKVVGRIAATVNNNYNAFHDCNIGFFGFYDTIDDKEVSDALLNTAMEYCKNAGVVAIMGPANLTTNDTAGLLVDGFDSPPFVQMTYNKPYYMKLLEDFGFRKEMDMLAYTIPTKTVNEKALRLAGMLKERLGSKGVTFRNVDMKNFKREIAEIREVYKKAWEKNWGFVPPTNEEFNHLADGLKMILDSRYNLVAVHEGNIVGFAVGLPNINEILIELKRGRLLPFGIFKLLMRKSKVKDVRIVLLGVIPEYRKRGIEGVFFSELIESAKSHGLNTGEASWILENNAEMVKAAENLNGTAYKRYRIYIKDIN
jgi:GNAT superfamily N-acetyltransferase